MPLLPLLLLLLLTAACTGPEADRALHRAEALIATHPDSAAALLDSIAPHIGHSDTRRAAHTALTAHARHRADLPQLPITQLRWASQHYLLHPTPPTTPQALAHYQLGIAYQADTLHARALTAYNHAAQTATQLHDHHLLGLIYRQISYIYFHTHNATDQLYYSKLSLRHFQTAHSTPYEQYALLDVALAQNNAMNYDSCLTIVDDVITQAINAEEYSLLYEAIGLKAAACVATMNYPEAISLYKLLLATNGNLASNQLRDLSLAFVLHNQPDSAKIYLDQYAICLDHTDSLKTYYDYNLTTGNYKDAIDGLLADLQTQNQALSEAMTQTVTTAMREYQNYELQLHKHRIKQHRNTWIAISILSILAIALITCTYHYRSLRKDKKISDALIMAAELTQRLKDTTQALNHTTTKLDNTSAILSSTSAILNSNTRKLSTTSQTLQTIFSHQLTTLNSLCDALYTHTDTINPQHKHIKQIIDFGRNPESLTQIEVALNLIHSNVMADFRKDFPKQSEKNVTLFLYIILKLSSRALSILLNTDIEKIYKQKNQLKTTIRNSDSQNRDFYLSFF